MNALKKFTLPGLAALVFVALIVSLIGALGGPSNADVAARADASALIAAEQRIATIESAIANLPTSADVSALAAEIAGLRIDLANLPDYGPELTAFDNRLTVLENHIAAIETAATAAPTADPAAPATATPIAQAGSAGWANLPDNRQVWIGPQGNSAVHIEFINVDPAATEATIGLYNGTALHAFAAMGGNVQGCKVQVSPMRDRTILSCPVTTVQFAVSQDDELVTVTAPTFGTGNLTFNDVATLVRQGRLDQIGLWEPKAGFFLAWVSTQAISGLYVP